eukprot:PhM_4_TR16091/c2_g1_i1/m.90092
MTGSLTDMLVLLELPCPVILASFSSFGHFVCLIRSFRSNMTTSLTYNKDFFVDVEGFSRLSGMNEANNSINKRTLKRELYQSCLPPNNAFSVWPKSIRDVSKVLLA